MKLTPRRLSVEEFPEQQGWIGSLLAPINQAIQEMFAGLNNNITITDNLYQEIKSLTFTTDTTTYPIKFKTKFNKLPIGLHVIYCLDSLGATASAVPWVTWTYSDQLLTITNITNLTTAKTYTIRILVIYG